jgi:hypothetical protein
MSKMLELMFWVVQVFQSYLLVIKQCSVDPTYDAVDVQKQLAFIMDTSVCTSFPRSLLHERSEVTCSISLRTGFSVNIVVNSTVLPVPRLAATSPICSELVCVINNRCYFSEVDLAMPSVADTLHNYIVIVFMVPRKNNIQGFVKGQTFVVEIISIFFSYSFSFSPYSSNGNHG